MISRALLALLCTLLLGMPSSVLAQGADIGPVDAPPAEGPAYALNLEVDLPLLAIPAAALLAWPLSDTFAPPHCAPLCEPGELNALDALAAGQYDTDWALASDIGVGVLLGAAVLTPFFDEAPLDALNDLVVILQSIAWTNASALMVAIATRRPRPYVYSTEAPEALRRAPKSAFSFFSSHTGAAFAASTALFQTLRRRHPESPLPWVALAVGDAIATMVAVGRVQGGHHFPTDVIAGAVVGTCFGLLIPALHDHPLQVTPMSMPSGGGIAVSGRL